MYLHDKKGLSFGQGQSFGEKEWKTKADPNASKIVCIYLLFKMNMRTVPKIFPKIFPALNPAYARKMSERLEEILKQFKDDWDALERELRRFIQELRKGPAPIPGAPSIAGPFISLIADQLGGWESISESQKSKVVQVTVEMVERIQQEVRKVDFWRNLYAREVLTKTLVRDLDTSDLFPPGKERDLAQQIVALAKENHENLKR